MAILTVFVAFMVARPVLTLLRAGVSPTLSIPGDLTELPGLVGSAMIFVMVFFLAQLLTDRKRAEERRQNQLRRLAALHEINLATTSTLDFRKVLDLLLEKIDFFLPYSAVTLRLFNRESELLEPVACRNLDDKEWKSEKWRGGRGLANTVFETKTPMIISNAQTDPRVLDREFYRKHQLISYLGVPLTAKDQTLGVLNFYTKKDHEFSREEVEFLSMLASQAALAIHNSRLHEQTKVQTVELEKAYDEIHLRGRQEAAVAEFGRQALAGMELSELMDKAVLLLSQNLEVEYAKVLELLPDDKTLLLRAGVGWKKGHVGQATVRTGTESQAGYTLLTTNPVITEDIHTETRFRGPQLLLDHGVVSGLSVVIQGQERSFGVLGAHTSSRRIFSQDDIHFLQAVANILSTAIERKRAEESLLEIQARLQLAIQGSNTGLWDWDLLTNEAYYSPEWKKQLGYEDHEIPNRFEEWENRLHPEDRNRMLTIVKSYLGNPWPDYEAEFRLRHKDGSYRWILARAAVLRSEDGKAYRMLGCHIDITDHKKAQEKIQGQLRRLGALHEINLATTSTLELRTLLDLLLEKIDLFFPYSVITLRLLNPSTNKLEPVACRNLDEQEWRSAVKEERLGVARAVLEKKGPLIIADVQKDPRTRHREYTRKQGLVSFLGLPLIAKSDVLGVLSFFTKEKHDFGEGEVEFLSTLASQAAIAIHNSQLYEQIKQQAVELKRANRTKDEFLSVVSHELRTPLNTIVGYTEMVKDKMLGEIRPEQEKALGKVLARSKDLLGMIKGILEATSIGTGAVKVESREVRLEDFFNECRLTYDITMMKKKLALNWDYPTDLPVVRTDREKLRHILQNLVHNAIKFTDNGHVTISARYRKQCQAVELKVADTGVGISEEYLSSIFEIFRQVDSSETRVYGGAGVGLYIVKKFTDLLGGNIEVKSKPGKGSTFTVNLPAPLA
jgi:PAS domain S-box-containing protein